MGLVLSVSICGHLFFESFWTPAVFHACLADRSARRDLGRAHALSFDDAPVHVEPRMSVASRRSRASRRLGTRMPCTARQQSARDDFAEVPP